MTFASPVSVVTANIPDGVVHSLSTNINSSNVSSPEGCLVKQASRSVPWDNERNLIPKQVDVIVNILCTGILLPLCFLLSFSTNVINMAVFYKQGLKERINVCLFSLSLVDMLYVAAAYGYSSDVLYMFAVGKGDTIGPSAVFFARNYLIGMTGFVSSSQVVSSVIALERCLCVTRPLLVKNLMSTKRTSVVLWSLILIITTGIFIGTGTRYGVVCIFDVSDNSTSYQLYPSQFYFENQQIIHIFSGIIYGLLLPALCASCVTCCTVVTVVEMKKLSRWRETVSSASDSFSSRDLAITRMIVGSSALFTACVIPSIAVRVSVVLVPDLKIGGRYENLYSVLLRLFMLSSVINSTFNFFVYYVYGSRFRQTVRQLFLSFACCPSKTRK